MEPLFAYWDNKSPEDVAVDADAPEYRQLALEETSPEKALVAAVLAVSVELREIWERLDKLERNLRR